MQINGNLQSPKNHGVEKINVKWHLPVRREVLLGGTATVNVPVLQNKQQQKKTTGNGNGTNIAVA